MKKILYFACIALVFSACKKEKGNEPPIIIPDAGLLVLNEGNSNQNNASITYYDFETETESQISRCVFQ